MNSRGTPLALAARSAEILAHPRFTDARRTAIDRYLALYTGTPALNKLLVDGTRHVIIMFALCLASLQRDDTPETWLTIGKLQEIVTAYQVGSPGLVEAIVARMIDSGLMASVSAPTDRRKKLLVPTEALLAHDLDMLAAFAEPCLILSAHPALHLAMVRDRNLQRAHRIISVDAFGDALQMLAKHPEIMLFFLRDSGYMVLLALLQSALAPQSGNVSTIPYQNIGDRFGVSRSHVRNLVEDAEAAGLVRVLAPGGAGVEILPALMEKHDRYFADCTAIIEWGFGKAYDMVRTAAQSNSD